MGSSCRRKRGRGGGRVGIIKSDGWPSWAGLTTASLSAWESTVEPLNTVAWNATDEPADFEGGEGRQHLGRRQPGCDGNGIDIAAAVVVAGGVDGGEYLPLEGVELQFSWVPHCPAR